MKNTITALLVATTIANANCNQIETKVDDFTGVISKTHPLDFSSSGNPLSIYKTTKDNRDSYILLLSVKGSNIHSRLKNVDVKFFDGSVYSFPNASLNIRYSSGWNYSAYIELTSEQVLMLKNKRIQKYRLAIYHREVRAGESITFNDFVNCLVAVEKEQ